MPKVSRPAPRDHYLPSSTFVIDNGASHIKAGYAPESPVPGPQALLRCHVIPNALARTREKRTYMASQLNTQVSQWNDVTFRRPVERGQLVSWEAEKEIWDYSFFDEQTAKRDLLVKQPEDTTLILTEAPNTLPFLQRNADEIIMEEWGFGGYVRVVGPALNAYNDLHALFGDMLVSPPPPDGPALPLECLLVIDSGFSHTTITPLYDGRPLQRAIRRLDFGGKHLTNLLKEVISVRYFDLHQDVKVVNDIKEDVCFVSQDFKADMEKTWKGNIGRQKAVKTRRPRTPSDEDEDEGEDDTSDEDAMDTDDEAGDQPPDADQTLSIDYILPDGLHIKRGFARPHNPLAARGSNKNKRKLHASGPESPADDDDNYVSMTLSSERFTVPEILFSPSDTGSTQPGLAVCVMQSLSVLPRALQASLLSNILVVGGNAKIPGFVQRVQREVRMQAPSEFVVRARKMEDPVTSAWLGGARMAGNREVVRRVGVSREEYFERGSGWVGRRFGSGGGANGGGGGANGGGGGANGGGGGIGK